MGVESPQRFRQQKHTHFKRYRRIMANDEAWQAGVDIATRHKNKLKAQKSQKEPKAVRKITTSDPSLGELTPSAVPKIYRKGGKVKKTGVALVHRGEYVLTAKQAKKKAHGRKRVAGKR